MALWRVNSTQQGSFSKNNKREAIFRLSDKNNKYLNRCKLYFAFDREAIFAPSVHRNESFAKSRKGLFNERR
ncbi:MAG: hypothetical protein ACK5JU_02020 [Bacteroidales bacterium]